MQKIIFFSIILLFSTQLFAQKAVGYTATDTKSNKIYFIKQGSEIQVVTDSSKTTIKLDSITKTAVYGTNQKFDIQGIKHITYKDKNLIQSWKKMSLYFFLTALGLIAFGGFLLLIFGSLLGSLLLLIGILLGSILIPVIIFTIVVSFGKKIRLK